MWQSRLKPKELTSHPKCQVQIDYKSHPELYHWLLTKSHETHHSMASCVRAILYEAMESDRKVNEGESHLQTVRPRPHSID